MGWSIKNLFREIRDAIAVLYTPTDHRRLLVYSEDIHSYHMFQGYLDTLMNEFGQSVVYVTSAPDDPLFNEHHEKMSVYYVANSLKLFIPNADSSIFMTTMPDLGNLNGRPPKETRCLYTFHSLNSIHEVYRPGAFDHYDAFFCAGPHHKLELETHFRQKELPVPELFEVGYYKLDRTINAFEKFQQKDAGGKTILIAPSWGPNNLLTKCGVGLIRELLKLDVDIIVRPHPCFFLPIFPEGQQTIERIEREFESESRLKIEKNINSEDSLYTADLMVSDYSGAAWEYALGTLRPVLFVNVPRKTFNPDWKTLGLPTFEDKMRFEVGNVIAPDDLADVESVVDQMLREVSEWQERLAELRARKIYNVGKSAEVGARIIDEMLREN